MRSPCLRCGRAVWHWPWQQAYCPVRILSSCAAIYTSLFEPPPPPTEVFDGPPEDMNVCSRCVGKKDLIFRKDFSTGAYEFMACPDCAGTGVVPVA